MSSNYTVLFDANVMYPAPLRSFLMYLALSGEFRARWTDQIHEEWIRNLLKNRPDFQREKLERVRDLMNSNVPGCLVSDYEPLIEALILPDADDRHVLAAAIKTRAEAIITFNLKDFPDDALQPYGVRAIHPDDFITDLLDLNASSVIEAARRQRDSLKNPPFTPDAFLNLLQKQRLPKSVSRLRHFELMI